MRSDHKLYAAIAAAGAAAIIGGSFAGAQFNSSNNKVHQEKICIQADRNWHDGSCTK